MIRKSCILFFLPLAGLWLASCGGGSATLANIQKDQQALVAAVPFEPPLFYQKEQELVGPEAELAKRIVNRIGEVAVGPGAASKIELKWAIRSNPGLIPALENEEADLIVSVLGITEEGKQHIQFSEPYYSSELVIIINPSNKDIRSARDLAGSQVGVRDGTAIMNLMKEKYSRAKIVPFKTLDDAVLALKRAEIEAIVDDKYMAAFSLDTVPTASYLEIVPGAVGKIDVAVGVRKGDDDLLQIVNEVIGEIKTENLYAQRLTEHDTGRLAKVEQRHPKRLQAQQKAKQPRHVVFRVSRDPSFNFDIYRLANLSYTLTNRETGQSYQSSRIDFQQSTGISSANLPPGPYLLSLPKYGMQASFQIVVEDPGQVTIGLRIALTTIHVTKS